MQIEETIKLILINDLFVDIPASAICTQDSLRNSIGLDSLGFSELRAQCEINFGVTIADDHFIPKHFASIQTLAALIQELKTRQ